MEDMENSQVSQATLNRVHEINAMEESDAVNIQNEKSVSAHLEEA
jgi:hypothetical protein